MSEIKELRSILYNHSKLISMISDKHLPIKQILLDDVRSISNIIETAKYHQKEEKK